MGRRFGIVLGTAAAFGALVSLAAGLAGLAGARSAYWDIPNHLAPGWLAGGGLALALAAVGLRGRPRSLIAAAALGAMALAGARIVPELAARRTVIPPPGAERLKLVQFNAFVHNRNPASAVDWLIAQDADVVVIEEGLGLPRAEVRRLRDAYPYCSGCGADDWWNVILAKRPPIAARRFTRTIPDGVSPAQGGWMTLAGAGGPFTVVGVHLTWPWLSGGPAQHRTLAQAAARLPKERLILAGDFNMTPWSFGLRRLDRALGLERLTHGQASWPAQPFRNGPPVPPFAPIDQVYAGPGWAAVSIRRGPSIGSDHRPIVVELAAVK